MLIRVRRAGRAWSQAYSSSQGGYQSAAGIAVAVFSGRNTSLSSALDRVRPIHSNLDREGFYAEECFEAATGGRLNTSGRGAAWLARLLGVQEVPGSNPGGPTNCFNRMWAFSGHVENACR